MLALTTTGDIWVGGALTIANLIIGVAIVLLVRHLLRGQAPTHS
jgi:hypothetical protein